MTSTPEATWTNPFPTPVANKTTYLAGFQYKDNKLEFFPHAEGYVKYDKNQYSYVFNYTDHLGNIRVSYSDIDKNGILGNEYIQECPKQIGSTPPPCQDLYVSAILEENHYYPFGLKHTGYNSDNAQPNYNYKYNGKELQTELGLNMYDYGARNYDPALGRWMNMDPLAEKTQEVYSYVWNNPIMNIDPDGRSGESTHTDKDGNVLAVFNDGDNSVYKHDTAESKDDVEKLRNEKSNNSGGGTKMGETEHWDEFVSPETGKTMTNYRIQFGKSFDPIIGKLNFESKKMDLKEIALNSRGGGIFDLKKDFKNVGALLEGKYATSRSAGNFLAGLNAEGGRMFGVGVNFETFQKLAGALHIEESNGNKLSSSQMKEIVVKGTYNSSNISNFAAPTWGEVNYQYRMSRAGWFKAENSGVMTLNY